MQRHGNYSTIKLDLCHDEMLVEPPILQPIHHPYSDLNTEDLTIQTYCLEEIFAEKLRALIERTSPRDLYDVVHLHQDSRWKINQALALNILKQKCAFKKLAVPTKSFFESLPGKEALVDDWNNMLGHQIADLQTSEYYLEQLSDICEMFCQ